MIKPSTARNRAAKLLPVPRAEAKLSDSQRAYQVRVNRFHGVRPPRDYVAGSDRATYVVWWQRSIDARDALRVAKTLERQTRQDAALLPAPKAYVPRKRVNAVVPAQDSDAYPATVLLDRRVSVKVNPRSRRSVKGQATGYECTVTRANGAHLDGKPVCKGQTLWVPLGMLETPRAVANATPTGARAKRNAAKKRAKQGGSKPPVKPATAPAVPTVKAPIRESESAFERTARTRAVPMLCLGGCGTLVPYATWPGSDARITVCGGCNAKANSHL